MLTLSAASAVRMTCFGILAATLFHCNTTAKQPHRSYRRAYPQNHDAKVDIDYDKRASSRNKYMAQYRAMRKRHFAQQVTLGNIDVGPPQESKRQLRQIVYTATVNLQAREAKIEDARKRVTNKAGEFDGYMLSSHNTTVIVKIPADKLGSFLRALRDVGDNVTHSLYASDISDRYTDLELRLKSARKLHQKLLLILKKAKTVEESLKVEVEASNILQKIERLTGTLKQLTDQIAMSKVTVLIRHKYVRPTVQEYKPGPLGWPFYATYKGIIYAGKGIYWLFVWEERAT